MSCNPPAPAPAPAAPRCEPMPRGCAPTAGAPPAPATCPTLSFCSGNYTYTYEAGCLRRTARSSPIPDGWYARVRIQDGCIVEASEGPAPVTQLPSPCIQGDSGGGGGATPTLSPDTCNLTRFAGGSLTTNLIANDSRYIIQSGCGTAASPFVMTLDVEQLREDVLGDFSFNQCGIRIERGAVRAFVPPVTEIKVEPDSWGTVVRDGCSVTLRPRVLVGAQVYTRMFCCDETVAGSEKTILGAMGAVYASTNGTAFVEICPVDPVTTIPTIPNSFESIQKAVEWLDSATITCPITVGTDAVGGAVGGV
jgi:hypothetical protein